MPMSVYKSLIHFYEPPPPINMNVFESTLGDLQSQNAEIGLFFASKILPKNQKRQIFSRKSIFGKPDARDDFCQFWPDLLKVPRQGTWRGLKLIDFGKKYKFWSNMWVTPLIFYQIWQKGRFLTLKRYFVVFRQTSFSNREYEYSHFLRIIWQKSVIF